MTERLRFSTKPTFQFNETAQDRIPQCHRFLIAVERRVDHLTLLNRNLIGAPWTK